MASLANNCRNLKCISLKTDDFQISQACIDALRMIPLLCSIEIIKASMEQTQQSDLFFDLKELKHVRLHIETLIDVGYYLF